MHAGSGARSCVSVPGMSQQLDDAQIKHLEFIQAVITRLANNSFLMKGWALTVAGLIFGFAAYFLRQERLFRRLYDAVRRSDPPVEPFSMDTRDHAAAVPSWLATALSGTLLPFYGVVVLVGLILILVNTFQK